MLYKSMASGLGSMIIETRSQFEVAFVHFLLALNDNLILNFLITTNRFCQDD